MTFRVITADYIRILRGRRHAISLANRLLVRRGRDFAAVQHRRSRSEADWHTIYYRCRYDGVLRNQKPIQPRLERRQAARAERDVVSHAG